MSKQIFYFLIGLIFAAFVSVPLHFVRAEEHKHGDHEEKGKSGEHGEDSEEHGEHHDEHGAAISAETLKASGVTLERSGTAMIAATLRLNGQVVPIEDKTAHLVPRFPGIVRDVRKNLGDEVKEGETVAIIESNQSLQQYEVKSLIAGTITKRHVTRGEFASDSTEIFEVIDLSELYADFFAFAPDFSHIKIGQRVILNYQGKILPDFAAVSFLSPLIDEATQSKFIRARIRNPNKFLSPGAFIIGDMVLEEASVPIAVKASAIQSHEGKQVVFVKEGERFEPRPISTGRSDGISTEILSGLAAGEEYAAGNTFIIKAEIGKGAAEHEH